MKVKNVSLGFIVLLAACSQGRDVNLLDGGADMNLVACTSSDDCTNRGEACFSGFCRLIKPCDKSADCSANQMCYQGQCRPNGTQACSADESQCKTPKGTFVKSPPGTNYCQPFCNTDNSSITDENQKIYCPVGFTCVASRCRPVYDDIPKPCAGCFADADCPAKEICNFNSHRCITDPKTGPDARFILGGANGLSTSGKVGFSVFSEQLGFSAHRDPSFDYYGLKAGECGIGHQISVEDPDHHAVLSLAPYRDAGDPITLLLSTAKDDVTKELFFDRQKEGYYSWRNLTNDDWFAGPASWKIPAGKDIAALQANGVIPKDFTTTPSLIDPANPMLKLKLTDEVAVTFDTPAEEGVGSYLVASYQFVTSDQITVACRAAEGQQKVVLPKSVLDENNKFHVGGNFRLFAIRANVVEVARDDVKQARFVWTWNKEGFVTLVE